MTAPILAQYTDPTTNQGRRYRYPWPDRVESEWLDTKGNYYALSVTNVLGALNKGGGLAQWAADITAAKAALDPDALLRKTEAGAFNSLRYEHSYELKRAADQGTLTHAYLEAQLNDLAEMPDYVGATDSELELASRADDFLRDYKPVAVATEATVWGHPSNNPSGKAYAGTLDAILKVDGGVSLVDYKSSRNIHPEYLSQLAGLGNADELIRNTGDPNYDPKHKPSWDKVAAMHESVPIPDFDSYGIVQLRPTDYDAQGRVVESFYQFIKFDRELVDDAFLRQFHGALIARYAQIEFKKQWEAMSSSIKAHDFANFGPLEEEW